MAKTSHKHRAFKMLEALGYIVADVETHLRHSFVTRDLFNFADLIAVGHGSTIAIQATDTTSVSKRVDKCLAEPCVAVCLANGWIIEVWGVRDESARDGSIVLARSLELSEDGQEVVAFDGSIILERSV
jgi:hypothetical protein